MEPLRFTIGLLNDATRRKVTAWRTLSFIPKEKLYRSGGYGPKAEEAHRAYLDYQFLLHKSLESFRDFVKKGGVYWEVTHQNKKLPLVLKLYSGMLQGDTVGHNRAVGHYHGGSMKTNTEHRKLFLCRRCNTPYSELDNWDFPFKLHNPEKIQDKMGKRKPQSIKYGFRCSQNNECTSAFDELGGPIQRVGMMATVGTPQDILHGFSERERAIEAFKEQERREKKSNSTERGIRLFTGEYKTMVEQACNVWGILYHNQSDRGLPRTTYRMGALSTEKLQSNEKSGLLLLYLTYMCSTVGDYMLSIPEPGATKANDYTRKGLMELDRMLAWVSALDNMLLCEAFMKDDALTKYELDLYKKYMPIYLDTIADAERRLEGDGLKLPKLHGRLHNAMDIENYGPAKGFDTETGECGHIEGGKKHAHKTQKRAWLQDEQQAKQYAIGVTINSSYAALELKRGTGNERRRKGQDNRIYKTLQGKDFHVWKEEPDQSAGGGSRINKQKATICECNRNQKQGKRADWHGNTQAQLDLEIFFAKKVFPLSDCNHFQIYNSYHPVDETGESTGIIYRAEPGKTTQKGYNRGWMDWAWVNIGGNETMAHLICFVELTAMNEQKDLGWGGLIEKSDQPRKYAIINLRDTEKQMGKETLIYEDEGVLMHFITKLTKQGKDKRGRNKPKDPSRAHLNLAYTAIPVEWISRPCICVPDIRPRRITGVSRTQQDFAKGGELDIQRVDYIHVPSPSTWKDLFVKKMEASLVPMEEENPQQVIEDRTKLRKTKIVHWQQEGDRKRKEKQERNKGAKKKSSGQSSGQGKTKKRKTN
jgi:hypothetical protein